MLQEDEYWPSVGSKPRNQDEQQTVLVRGRGRGRARRMGRHQFEWEASAGCGDGAWHAGDLDLAVIILNRTIILMANTNQRKLRGDNRATH